MPPNSSGYLLAFVLVLAVAAGALVVADQASQDQNNQRAEQFQTLVGGLGLGPAVDLAHCAFTFDPRLCPRCQQADGAIPGGMCFCPHHGCSVFFYPPLDSVRQEPLPDALSP